MPRKTNQRNTIRKNIRRKNIRRKNTRVKKNTRKNNTRVKKNTRKNNTRVKKYTRRNNTRVKKYTRRNRKIKVGGATWSSRAQGIVIKDRASYELNSAKYDGTISIKLEGSNIIIKNMITKGRNIRFNEMANIKVGDINGWWCYNDGIPLTRRIPGREEKHSIKLVLTYMEFPPIDENAQEKDIGRVLAERFPVTKEFMVADLKVGDRVDVKTTDGWEREKVLTLYDDCYIEVTKGSSSRTEDRNLFSSKLRAATPAETLHQIIIDKVNRLKEDGEREKAEHLTELAVKHLEQYQRLFRSLSSLSRAKDYKGKPRDILDKKESMHEQKQILGILGADLTIHSEFNPNPPPLQEQRFLAESFNIGDGEIVDFMDNITRFFKFCKGVSAHQDNWEEDYPIKKTPPEILDFHTTHGLKKLNKKNYMGQLAEHGYPLKEGQFIGWCGQSGVYPLEEGDSDSDFVEGTGDVDPDPCMDDKDGSLFENTGHKCAKIIPPFECDDEISEFKEGVWPDGTLISEVCPEWCGSCDTELPFPTDDS